MTVGMFEQTLASLESIKEENRKLFDRMTESQREIRSKNLEIAKLKNEIATLKSDLSYQRKLFRNASDE